MELYWKVLFLTSAFLLMHTTSADGTVNLEVSKSPVKVGDRVVFTCRVQGKPTDTFVIYNKVVKLDGTIKEIEKETITQGNVLVGPYKSPGRFRFEKSTDGNDIVLTLTIDAVQVEDSGAYSCSIPEETYSAKLLEVYRLPESIKFINYNESDVVEVLENQLLPNITCRVSRVMPHPDVMVTVGNRDVTNDFLTTAETIPQCNNIGSSTKTCPLHTEYKMDVFSREFRPTHADNGMKLTCTSKMRVFEQDQVSTSLILDVKHVPKINCSSPLVIPVNQTSVQMRCTIFSNPSIGPTTWVINRGTTNEVQVTAQVVSINPLSADDDYSAVDTVDPNNPTRIESTLVIRKSFTKEQYQHTFSVDARNELGSHKQDVIVRMPGSSPSGTGVSHLPSTFILLFSTLLVLTTSILLSRSQ